jgi:YXWGXW repeat-containing protein
MREADGKSAKGDLMLNRVIRSMLFMIAMVFLSSASFAQVRVSVRIAPPELAVYEQPICPGDGYIWTPGYWAFDDDYYWVPGEWVLAPEPGYLWTPGYWGWGDDGYFFNDGYWGTEVGFYGGINYGFGYFGHGYEGGRWDGGHFYYNTSVNHINGGSMHFTYNTRVNEGTTTRVSFNGGNGGVNARATSQEEAASHARHIAPVASQTQHVQAAHSDPQARLSANHGAPSGRVAESGGGNAAAHTEVAARPASTVHPKDLPAVQRPVAPNSGNVKTDQKYQQQQDKLVATQTKERQNLQQKQENEHQQLTRQKATPEKTQQVEQQHEQQTRQLQLTHTQQMQQMQQRQAPPPARAGRGH